MAKVKLKLQDKTDSELLDFARQHIAAMAGNANFVAPIPPAAGFLVFVDEFQTAMNDSAAAQQTAKQMTTVKDTRRTALETALGQRGSYVDSTSGGDEPMILSSGLPIRDARAPIGAMTAPLDFLATMGDKPGEVDLTWSRVRGARTYVVEHSHNVTPRVWTQKAIVTSSKATITGCTPGELCVFRVAAIGSSGQGPWSDESVKMSP